ncbi:MAG: hypothetical protein V3W44_10120 [Dehalococcoidales bacterium]
MASLIKNVFTLIKSDIVTVGTTIDLDQIDTTKPHCFAGLQFFADSEGAVEATPGAGTVVITVQLINAVPVFEAITNGIIDVTNYGTVSWAGNTVRVLATPSGLTVATHYRLIVTCNET